MHKQKFKCTIERYNLKWDLKTGWVYSGGHAVILVVNSINGGNNGFVRG